MKGLAAIVLASLSLGGLWRESSSHAASESGRHAFETKEYARSVERYERARALAPSRVAAFNLGTAQIAAGARGDGAASLAPAIEDPALAADAYFNRGNGALASKALDRAVLDYVNALKANPNHAAAKRNLEIALARREAQRRASAQQQQQQPQPQPAPRPQQGQQKLPRGQADLDALLRSVQQQEQEELRRMKARAGEARIGW